MLPQLSADDEIILVDDASPDNFSEAALRLASASGIPLRLVRNTQNMGPSFSKASGIEIAARDIILLLDSDDLIPEGAVQEIKNGFASNPEADFLFGNYKRVQFETGRASIVNCREIAKPSGELDAGKLALNWILLGSSPFRRQAVRKWGNYDGNFPVTDDIDFWRRALLNGARGQHIDSVIYVWNLSNTGNHSKQSQRELAWSWLRNGLFYRRNLSCSRFLLSYLGNAALLVMSFAFFFLDTRKAVENLSSGLRNLGRVIVRNSRLITFSKKRLPTTSLKTRGLISDKTVVTVFHHFTKRSLSTEILEPSVWINTKVFENFILDALAEDYEFLSLDDMVFRNRNQANENVKGIKGRSICITVDDGYKSFVDFGLPIVEKYSVPFTVFVCGGFSESKITPWWESLEQAILANDEILFYGQKHASCSPSQKRAVFNDIKQHFLAQDSLGIDLAVGALLEENRVVQGTTVSPFLDVEGLLKLSKNPLCSISDHSYTHLDFTRLPVSELIEDIARNRDFFQRIGLPTPRHFAFPFGAADGRLLSEVTRLGYESISVSSNLTSMKKANFDVSSIAARVNVEGFAKWKSS